MVELMGHRSVVGLVTRSSDPLVRVDVPEIDGRPAFTQEYGKASIYCISWMDEAAARVLLKSHKQEPPFAWMMPRQLVGFDAAAKADDDDDLDTDDDEGDEEGTEG